MAVIGIDLGTTNSLGAVWKEGEVSLIADGLGNRMVPGVPAYFNNDQRYATKNQCGRFKLLLKEMSTNNGCKFICGI